MEKNLREKIIKNRKEFGKEIKDSTLNIYLQNIKKVSKYLNDGEEKSGTEWLKDIKKVEEKMEDLKYTTIRNYFNSIIIYLHALNDGKLDKLVQQYSEKRDELNKIYEDEQATGVISESQGKNMATLDEIHKVITDIGEELKSKGIKSKGSVNLREKSLLQVYIILNIHLTIPLRNDLANTQIIQKRAFNKMTLDDKKKTNFLVIEKNKFWFCLNDYKTSKIYKEKCIPVPDELKKVLRFYFKVMDKEPGDYLLTKSDNVTPITRNQISQMLTKVFKKRLNKSISSTLLRKIYLSHKYGDVKEEMEKDASMMGHSVQMAQKVYVKKVPQQEEEHTSSEE